MKVFALYDKHLRLRGVGNSVKNSFIRNCFYWISKLFHIRENIKQYIFSVALKEKVTKKSRECHNHKPQPFPDPKRKRKPTKSKQAQTEQTYEKQ